MLKIVRTPWWGREKGGYIRERGREIEGHGERRGRGKGSGGEKGKEGEKGGRKGKRKKVPPIFQTKFTPMSLSLTLGTLYLSSAKLKLWYSSLHLTHSVPSAL